MDIPSGDVLIQELDPRIDWSIRELAHGQTITANGMDINRT
ncbi:MAG: hypothetical protein ACYDCW_10520 [Acidithiobacillus ferrivorans]